MVSGNDLRTGRIIEHVRVRPRYFVGKQNRRNYAYGFIFFPLTASSPDREKRSYTWKESNDSITFGHRSTFLDIVQKRTVNDGGLRCVRAVNEFMKTFERRTYPEVLRRLYTRYICTHTHIRWLNYKSILYFTVDHARIERTPKQRSTQIRVRQTPRTKRAKYIFRIIRPYFVYRLIYTRAINETV